MLQLPDGEFSLTNGFISPVSYMPDHCILSLLFFLSLVLYHSFSILQVWGGVVVWNPPACFSDVKAKDPLRPNISPEVGVMPSINI